MLKVKLAVLTAGILRAALVNLVLNQGETKLSINYEQIVADVTNKKEAVEAISILINEAYSALHHAEVIADKWNTLFYFEPAYGMGGSYTPDHEDAWNESSRGEWVSSSSNC